MHTSRGYEVFLQHKLCRNNPMPVADAGFHKGGYSIGREKFSRPGPLLIKPHPFSSAWERNFLSYLSIHPKVSQRSRFLS